MWAIKNVSLYFCPYLCQLLTDFKKFFHWHTMQTICNNVIIINPIYYISRYWVIRQAHSFAFVLHKQKIFTSIVR